MGLAPIQIVEEIFAIVTSRAVLRTPRVRIAEIYRRDEWGRPDSNWRRPKSGDLQSPAIAAMRHPRERGFAGERT